MQGVLLGGMTSLLLFGLAAAMWGSRRRPATRLRETLCWRRGLDVHVERNGTVSVTLNTTQKFNLAVKPTLADGVTPGTLDGPVTYAVSTPGIVTLSVASDSLSTDVLGAAAGTVTITPTATAGGKTITGSPVQVVVTLPPQPATQLVETIGPVVAQ
jgi:hypothetical protein